MPPLPRLRSLLTRPSLTTAHLLPTRPYLTRFLLKTSLLLLWTPTIAFLFEHIGRIYNISGSSMYPFLNTDYQSSLLKDRIYLNKYNPTSSLHRGQIVAFHSPARPEYIAVKRIIALEGDVVTTKAPCREKEMRVPVGHVWVEGEHPDGGRSSQDSNAYGPVPVNLLVGKVSAVVWPWEKAGWVRWQDWRGSGRVREGRGEEEGGELFTS